MTDISIDTFKKNIAELLRQKYHGFIAEVKSLPMHAELQADAIKHFDTGFLWLREALFMANLVVQNAIPNDPAPPAGEPIDPPLEPVEGDNANAPA